MKKFKSITKSLVITMILAMGITAAPTNILAKDNAAINYPKYTVKATEKKVQKTFGTEDRLNVIDRSILFNYWHKPDFAQTQKAGITEKSNIPLMEKLYRLALKVDPLNPKYLDGLGSVLMMQDGKSNQAMHAWNSAVASKPGDYYAKAALAGYFQYMIDDPAFNNSINDIAKGDSQRASRLKYSFDTLTHARTMKLNTKNSELKLAKNDPTHFIVLLGFVLDDKGKIQPTLKQRLNTTLKLAQSYPKARILVAGGQLPQEPKVESTVMKKWLVKKGIKSSRITQEDRSLDTVENSLNSSAILKEKNAKTVTLVTSASHMRRAWTLFEIGEKMAYSDQDYQYSIENLVSIDDKKFLQPITKATDAKKIVTDLLRINGYWVLPEIQR
ncbi:YdcF family protein [Xylocopilactobacillus apis]|uniref:Transporter n=1 Tax=Xylocopilactobacillus apis TaxID=2932183 RepID=A0AAU9D1F9_9LACO|nr:YdcF family protein [Xylocopilactobacillus apis]BDR57358.1 transporter [Xylocopilactobacillus apis]